MAVVADAEERAEGRYIHELELVVDFATRKELELRFETGRKIYNALLGEALKRVRRVRHELRAHNLMRLACKAEADAAIAENELAPRSDEAKAIRKKAYKPYNDARNALLKEHKCSRFGLSYYGTELSRKTPLWAPQHAIGATVVQELVRRAWLAAEKYMLDPRIKCKFVRYGDMHSVESMNDADAIRVVDDRVVWSSGSGLNRGGTISMRMRLDRKNRDWVEHHVRRCEIVKTRLVHRVIQGEERYFAQIVLAGSPADRPWITTIPGEDIGIDLGLSIVAIDSNNESAIYSLTTTTPEQRAELASKQRRTNRALERSRRASNPDNYDEKGRVKPRALRKPWKCTATYRALKAQYAEASRILTEQRKSATRTLVNHVVANGNVAVIEDLSLKKWQMEYGRSTGFAPGEFTACLDRRLTALNGSLYKIPAHKAKLSQCCIQCGTYEKRDFAIRVLERRQRCSSCGFDYHGVQADVVQAFLSRHVRVEGTVDEPQAVKAWAGASTRLGMASSTVHNVAKTVLARSRPWREKLRAAERRAMQIRLASSQESESLRLRTSGESASVKVAISYRAPKWGMPHAQALEVDAARKSSRSKTVRSRR